VKGVKETFFVVNPVAGRGKLKQLWNEIKDPIKKKLGKTHFEFTQGPEDASRLTREALFAGYSTIIAVGGDGTLNGCLNGFLEDDKPINPKASLGIFPMGRGSDFARSLGLSRKSAEALQQFQRLKIREIDIGKVTCVDDIGKKGKKKNRYFINVASAGIVGNVVNWANRAPSFLGADGAYLYSIIRGILEFRPQVISYDCQGIKKEEKILMMIIANSRYFGAGIPIAPKAICDDGLFDVMVIRSMGLFSMFRHLPKLYSGNHLRMPQVELLRTRHIEIHPLRKEKNLFVEADGDTMGELPATFEILPKAVRFLVPLI